MARYTVCPTCGADAPRCVKEVFDPQALVWTGIQWCVECERRMVYTRHAETTEEKQMAKKRAHRINTVKGNGAQAESREVAPAKRPRNKPLPGMEDVRIGGLDEICASVSEIREQMNTLRTNETGQLRTALGLMRKHDKSTWRAAGVELVRVPGEEKLRVRSSKEQATAEVDDDHVADEGDELEAEA